jgi:hypothetical protein
MGRNGTAGKTASTHHTKNATHPSTTLFVAAHAIFSERLSGLGYWDLLSAPSPTGTERVGTRNTDRQTDRQRSLAHKFFRADYSDSSIKELLLFNPILKDKSSKKKKLS